MGLILAVNLTDITFGWHGFRSGVGVYYYHWTQPQSELRELSLTADMIGLSNRSGIDGLVGFRTYGLYEMSSLTAHDDFDSTTKNEKDDSN